MLIKRLSPVVIIAWVLHLACTSLASARAPQPEPLNNLVRQLLNVSEPKAGQSYAFETTRDGFIWIQLDAEIYRYYTALEIWLNDDPAPVFTSADPRLHPPTANEVLHRLPPGEHTIRIVETLPSRYNDRRRFLGGQASEFSINDKVASRLINIKVNEVPDLYYWSLDQYWSHNHDAHEQFSWNWLMRNGLLNYTHLVIPHWALEEPYRSEFMPELLEWRSLGREILLIVGPPGRPGMSMDGAEIIEDTYAYHKRFFEDPLVDGVMIDELIPGRRLYDSRHPYWIEGYRRAVEEHPDKTMHIATIRNYEPTFDPLFALAMEQENVKLATQHYYRTPETEERHKELMVSSGERNLNRWKDAEPDILTQTSIITSLASSSIFSFSNRPEIDYKAHVDMQLYEIANKPAYRGLIGVSAWSMRMNQEELVRFISDAFRHYFLEGKTDRFYTEPYQLEYLLNGGFEDGLNHWQVREAAPGSVSLKTVGQEVPFVKRNPLNRVPEGETMLSMKISPNAPNMLAQFINNLVPGRKYVLEFYALNLDAHRPYSESEVDLVNAAIATTRFHPIIPTDVSIQGVEILSDESTINTLPQKIGDTRSAAEADETPDHFMPQNMTEDGTQWTHRYIVFRAESDTAALIISDSLEHQAHKHYVGQTIVYDFFAIYPYYE